MTVGIAIIVLLVFVLVGLFMLLALGLATRGRIILLDAKVTVICDELGVTLPVLVGYEENGEERTDAQGTAP